MRRLVTSQKLVFVRWIDSGYHINEGWKPVIDSVRGFRFSEMECESAGLLAFEDDDFIALTTTYNDATKESFGLQIIARRNILQYEVLYDPSSQ